MSAGKHVQAVIDKYQQQVIDLTLTSADKHLEELGADVHNRDVIKQQRICLEQKVKLLQDILRDINLASHRDEWSKNE